MTKLYKLTRQDNTTYNGTKWGENVTHESDGLSKELCNNHWLHAYQDPLLAVLMNQVHANISNPKLWECDGDVGLALPDKVGCTKLTTIKEIPLPEITTAQKVKFACLCARKVYRLWKKYDKDGAWLKWYNAGCNTAAADAATWAADAAVDAAVDAAASARAAAAAAAWAARAANVAAVDAAARTAADAAAVANVAATSDKLKLDLVAIAHKATRVHSKEMQVAT